MTVEVDVIEDPRRAQVLLHEVRIELLEHLAEPGSAASLARRLDLPRQRVNYHLRELEAHRLIELVEERRKGNVTERIYRRTGESYTISNAALGGLGSVPADIQDRFSSAYQIALASRSIRELATLQTGADAARKKLPTFALDVDVRFASAARRSEFAEDLAAAVADLVRKYHDDKAANGRSFRFYAGGYPRPKS
jgi:DNA-binding transcriptional ArsR family regulator